VQVDDETIYEPDALVHRQQDLAPNAVVVPDPLVVVEVLSPTTRGRDAAAKLEDYFRIASVWHYLLFKTERPVVIHHRRGRDGAIATRVLYGGPLALDPPGIVLELDHLLTAR